MAKRCFTVIESLDLRGFDTLSELVAELTEALETVPEEWRDVVTVYVDAGEDRYGGGEATLGAFYKRDETPEEVAEREAEEARRERENRARYLVEQELRREAELKQYARLKAKYG
jgi:hypothetical protein